MCTEGGRGMPKRDLTPVVRHSYAPDPDPAKVQAALETWRRALTERMLERIRGERAGDPSGGGAASDEGSQTDNP